MYVRSFGSRMSAPKCFFFSRTRPDRSFCPQGYPRGRLRDIRPQNLLFGLLFVPHHRRHHHHHHHHHQIALLHQELDCEYDVTLLRASPSKPCLNRCRAKKPMMTVRPTTNASHATQTEAITAIRDHNKLGPEKHQ